MTAAATSSKRGKSASSSVGQIVLVLQGGGALGAFQCGVYQALHEARTEPDWVIGTSIGAINGGLIAGNPPQQRLPALEAFWQQVTLREMGSWPLPGLSSALNDMAVMARGIAGFFVPNPGSWLGALAPVGLECASYYDTAPLRETLAGLIDVDLLNAGAPRLTVGAVNVRTATMRYFDSQQDALGLDHILASGALPPAFPAVRIGGQSYWDGGIYSNTPIEAVLDDHPRRDSLIFAVNVWHGQGAEPTTIAQVMGRQKDIQYASRARSHIARQQQIHHLRHVIRELEKLLPEELRESAETEALTAYGCHTIMHVAMLTPPLLEGEGVTKDIDFSAFGIATRHAAGYTQTRRMLERAPWEAPVDPMMGVIVHAPGDAN
jgi:NTE family protein